MRRDFLQSGPKYVVSLIRSVCPSNLLAGAGSFVALTAWRGRGKKKFILTASSGVLPKVRQGQFSEVLVG